MEQEIKVMLKSYEKALEDGGPLSTEVAAVLARYMESDMAVRDAVMLMSSCGRDVEWAERFISDSKAMEAEVSDMLRVAFKTGINEERLTYADIALSTMAIAAPHAAQPLAINAYLYWVAGDVKEACHMASLAFDRNPNNSLAALVASALAKGIKASDLGGNRD